MFGTYLRKEDGGAHRHQQTHESELFLEHGFGVYNKIILKSREIFCCQASHAKIKIFAVCSNLASSRKTSAVIKESFAFSHLGLIMFHPGRGNKAPAALWAGDNHIFINLYQQNNFWSLILSLKQLTGVQKSGSIYIFT